MITNLENRTLEVYDKTLDEYLNMIVSDEGTITKEDFFQEISNLTDEIAEDVMDYLVYKDYMTFDEDKLEYTYIYYEKY